MDFNDPIVILGGDFNRRGVGKALEPFPDIKEHDVPPTRGGAALNITASNLIEELRNIYKLPALNNACWPKRWKMESVTIIPKVSKPESFNNLRNISCTPLFSKVLEFFLFWTACRLRSSLLPWGH